MPSTCNKALNAIVVGKEVIELVVVVANNKSQGP
jgi:hypothetical protein